MKKHFLILWVSSVFITPLDGRLEQKRGAARCNLTGAALYYFVFTFYPKCIGISPHLFILPGEGTSFTHPMYIHLQSTCLAYDLKRAFANEVPIDFYPMLKPNSTTKPSLKHNPGANPTPRPNSKHSTEHSPWPSTNPSP